MELSAMIEKAIKFDTIQLIESYKRISILSKKSLEVYGEKYKSEKIYYNEKKLIDLGRQMRNNLSHCWGDYTTKEAMMSAHEIKYQINDYKNSCYNFIKEFICATENIEISKKDINEILNKIDKNRT